MDATADLTPLVLLVDDQEWTSRSIESILRPRGHVVLKAYTGQQALDLVGRVSPDALIVDVNLPDFDGIDLVRRLRKSPTIHSLTPVLMITSGSLGRAERLEALAAGAWDILTHPVDPKELVLRMDTFVRAKQEADRIRDEGLTDARTGLYNVRGLLRRAEEISADAVRFERPLTCIAFGSRIPGEGGKDWSIAATDQRLAAVLLSVIRHSDTVGRVGPTEFVVVAPGTGSDGALRLADRVLEAFQDGGSASEALGPEELSQLRAGFYALRTDEPATAEDLLLRATLALRQAQSGEDTFRVRAYDA